jgi:hypothetical protein
MPENFYDLPFIYVSDADGYTDGASYNNVPVDLINNSDFLLRRICGVNNVVNPNGTGKFRFRDANNQNMIQTPISMPNDYPLVPEFVYPPTAQISYDILNVLRANNTYTATLDPNYYSQIAFQGVRRFYGTPTPESNYRYYERPYTIRMDFTVTREGRVAPAYVDQTAFEQFSVLVDNWDFVMQSMVVLITTESGRGAPPVLSQNKLKLVLYTHQEQAMMSAPVVDEYLSSGGLQFNSWFPVPTMLYPANSVIRVDVQSLLVDGEVPADVTILFNGLWRFPC